MSVATPTRSCPACGARTLDPYCPNDGVATVQRQTLRADATMLFEGEVVAGRYRVTGVLGKGGFGAVYAAVHTSTRQHVALKLMLLTGKDGDDDESEDIGPTEAERDAEIRRFFREAEVTAALRHPNTVRVFDMGQADSGALFIAMELLTGITLEKRLKQAARAGTALPVDESVRIAIDVLKSLAEAHDQGLVHRDLKPANIMLTEVAGEPITKVLDFGIARPRDSSLTGSNAALGTPAYMSPEQCRAKPLTGASDLYSLGVILFRCVTGRLPFDDANPMALMLKHVTDPAPDVLGLAKVPVTPAFAACVARALAKEPGERYSDARAMRADLEAAAHGGGWVGASTNRRPSASQPAEVAQVDVASETLAAPTLADIAGRRAATDSDSHRTRSDHRGASNGTSAYGAVAARALSPQGHHAQAGLPVARASAASPSKPTWLRPAIGAVGVAGVIAVGYGISMRMAEDRGDPGPMAASQSTNAPPASHGPIAAGPDSPRALATHRAMQRADSPPPQPLPVVQVPLDAASPIAASAPADVTRAVAPADRALAAPRVLEPAPAVRREAAKPHRNKRSVDEDLHFVE